MVKLKHEVEFVTLFYFHQDLDFLRDTSIIYLLATSKISSSLWRFFQKTVGYTDLLFLCGISCQSSDGFSLNYYFGPGRYLKHRMFTTHGEPTPLPGRTLLKN